MVAEGQAQQEGTEDEVVPVVANPFRQAYVYGLMLGPIALPCAGPFLVSLLGISLGVADAVGKVGTFLVFGLGFGLPLVILSLVAGVRSREIFIGSSPTTGRWRSWPVRC